MAYIQSAFYGDEKSNKKITDILRDKIIGTTLDLTVNDQLIPPFEVAEKVALEPKEEAKIRDQASKACGGADQACIERTIARLQQDKLSEKQGKIDAAAIKGKRLTINYIDENNKPVRKVIPEGQKFKLDNIMMTDPKKGAFQVPPTSYFQNQLQLLGMLALTTFIYVFSVAATYVLFVQTDFGIILAAPATAIAAFVPYSGYFLIFLYFMFTSAINTYIGKI